LVAFVSNLHLLIARFKKNPFPRLKYFASERPILFAPSGPDFSHVNDGRGCR